MSGWSERVELERLLVLLQQLPDVRASLDPLSQKGCTLIKIKVAGKSATLLVTAKKNAYPRDVRQIIGEAKAVKRYQCLLLAEAISPGAKDLLRAERIAYYDSGDSLFLPLSGAYIYIDKPEPKALQKSLKTLFSGRRAQVLHVLLNNSEDWFGVVNVAKQAIVAPSTVSEVFAELEQAERLVSRGQGPNKERHLQEPGALLDEWAKQYSAQPLPQSRRYYVPTLKGKALVARLAEVFKTHQIDYALSFETAAQNYAPFLSTVPVVRARALADKNIGVALAELGARPVEEGANLVITEAGQNDLLFRQQIDGVWLASPLQVYLDLQHGEGRAKEMAAHLRQERIGF